MERGRRKNFRRWLILILILLLGSNFSFAQGTINLKDLPLEASLSKGKRNDLVLYLTGDGGWNSFSQKLKEEFEKKGYGVVSLNSRKYFWKGKSPEVFARDMEKISNYFMGNWKKASLIIVGYSFGADVASFLPNLLTTDLKQKIKKIALLSPSASTDFEVRLSDLLATTDDAARKYKVGGEIKKNRLPMACIFGKNEN
ncbi:MAG TPA: AcvB/VirJ family lysyl-phosphatidylglycerol hydrolase, partial [Draconibacterium sp.]|nr:AcvB/VirJ family lysyl-phosphatidylglycerol hydrolase [Draconibacterium sp.]